MVPRPSHGVCWEKSLLGPPDCYRVRTREWTGKEMHVMREAFVKLWLYYLRFSSWPISFPNLHRLELGSPSNQSNSYHPGFCVPYPNQSFSQPRFLPIMVAILASTAQVPKFCCIVWFLLLICPAEEFPLCYLFLCPSIIRVSRLVVSQGDWKATPSSLNRETEGC